MSQTTKVKSRPPPIDLYKVSPDLVLSSAGTADVFLHMPSNITTPSVVVEENVVEIIESPAAVASRSVVEASRKEEEEDDEILYQQFEGTLFSMLHEEELIPFNIHTAASLGNTGSVRHLIER